MITIKINGEYLDIETTRAEMERTSPLFASEQLLMEYSTPFTIPYTEKNARLLELSFQFLKKRLKKKVQGELFDGNSFVSVGTLVVESSSINFNDIRKTKLTGYFLSGASTFFTTIKGKKLCEMVLDGDWIYPWTTNNPDDGSDGWWQYIHSTWAGTDSVLFGPVRNENEAFVGHNLLEPTTGKIRYAPFDGNSIAPQIRVKYLFEKIFAEHGWQVDFSDINDTDWEKLWLYSNIEVDWWEWRAPNIGDPKIPQPKQLVIFNRSKHVPQEDLISDFLIQWANRLGWAWVMNGFSKICRAVALKEVDSFDRVNWTDKLLAQGNSEFNEDDKVYALQNDINAKDTNPSTPDFKGYDFLPAAEKFADFPAATDADYKKLKYAYLENKWYTIDLDDNTNEYYWKAFADNIYNYEPDGFTDAIATTVSTIPLEKSIIRTSGPTEYYGLLPYVKIDYKEKNFGYRVLFYHGLQLCMAPSGGYSYPLLTPLHFTNDATDSKTAWSFVYKHEYNGTDWGIYKYWWDKWVTRILKRTEEIVIQFKLTRYELSQFKWDSWIMLYNVPFIAKSYIEPIPFDGVVQFRMRRVIVNMEAEAEVINYWVELILENEQSVGPDGINFTSAIIQDLRIKLWSDAAGTIPYTPALPVTIPVKKVWKVNGNLLSETIDNYTVSAADQVVALSAFKSWVSVYAGAIFTYDYNIEPDPLGAYTVL